MVSIWTAPLSRGWIVSVKIKEQPHMKPKQQQQQRDGRSPLAVVVSNLLKRSSQWRSVDNHVPETITREQSVGTTRGFQNPLRWEVLDLWRQHHRSFHYIPHSPLNLIISCCAISWSVYGRITELDWIGQWSHCKCITLALPIFLSYLHTEPQYYCRNTTWCRCMHVKGFEKLEISVYKPDQCIIIYSVALYHWSNQSYVKYTFERERVLMKTNVWLINMLSKAGELFLFH